MNRPRRAVDKLQSFVGAGVRREVGWRVLPASPLLSLDPDDRARASEGLDYPRRTDQSTYTKQHAEKALNQHTWLRPKGEGWREDRPRK
jgi:hypothetical protein